MTDLTTRQQEILAYIRSHLSLHGCTPPTRAIAAHFKLGQTSAVQHLNRLEKKGLIQRTGRQYGLTGEIVMWSDVKPLLKLIDTFFISAKTANEFYAKYPHLKP